MPKIDRKDQKIFAGGVSPTNVVSQYGSLADGNPNYSSDPDVIQALSAYDNGWSSAVINNSAPALQDRNALDYLFSRQLAYLMEQGVPEYSATQTYYLYGIAKDPATGDLYRSLTDDNTGNALSDAVNWEPVAAPASATGAGLVTKDEVVEKFGNYFSNADFTIAQRGTSHSSSGYGSIDRFRNNAAFSGITMEQQPFLVGQTDVPESPAHFMRAIVSSVVGVANYANISQNIEYVKTLNGKEVTYSFWAKADAAKDISVELFQFFGTGGSPSSIVDEIGVQKFTLSTSWQFFSFTTNIPDIQGKSLGTDNNDRLAIRWWFDAGSDYNANTDNLGQQSGIFDIANVKLEEGSEATKFQLRNIHADKELLHCKRFYQKTYNPENFPPQNITSGSIGIRISGLNTASRFIQHTWDLEVEMRDIPVAAIYNNANNPVVVVSGRKHIISRFTTAVTADANIFYHADADAEL